MQDYSDFIKSLSSNAKQRLVEDSFNGIKSNKYHLIIFKGVQSEFLYALFEFMIILLLYCQEGGHRYLFFMWRSELIL